MAVRRDFVDGPFGQIHFRISTPSRNVKPPIVCLHMFPQSGRSFTELMPLLATDQVVIAPDFPGYGESDPPDQQVSAEVYADCIWRALDKIQPGLGNGSIDLFGIHAGAKLAVEAAFQRPHQVGRLMLCSAAVLTQAEIAKYWKSLNKIPLDDAGTRFQKFWRMQRSYAGDNVPLEAVAIAYAEMLRGGESYHWGHAATFDYNERFLDRLRHLSHPTLLINPGDDLYAMTQRTLPHLRNGRMLDRPHWKPGFLAVNARELADDMLQFLSDPEQAQNPEPVREAV
ncbi:alpha/beta fold hydrolase [Erythrobacter sp. W53]|uniref:alpha/beta fold hydrolase n=1 Tax=Erythrobacter sp. W53 TaxID=3425947 RepID=UPI003D767C04